jgi:hypothetical protein
MILKIQQKEAMTIFDGIESLTRTDTSYTMNEIQRLGADLNYAVFNDFHYNWVQKRTFITINAKKKDGTYLAIITEYPAFLMNDEGKTIEKIWYHPVDLDVAFGITKEEPIQETTITC